MTRFTSEDQMLETYLAAIKKNPVLSKAEECELARGVKNHGSRTAAQRLVVCNLRFVVKTAREFQGYKCSLMDMIQEGTLGLMRAVDRFDCSRGYRLITYAVWWIRAYIRRFVMRGWSQVKIGTTQAQRKLFFRVRPARSHADFKHYAARKATSSELAAGLNVKEEEFVSMEQRLAQHDFSLDAPLLSDGGATNHLDMLVASEVSPETAYGDQQMRGVLSAKVAQLVGQLNEKEKHIVAQRILHDDPQTLQAIGAQLKVSRERVRQIETNVIRKLRCLVEQDDKHLFLAA